MVAAQQPDGGVKTDTGARDSRIWATAYAIPAASGMSIPDSLEDFENPNFQTKDSAPVPSYEAALQNNRTIAAVASLYLSGNTSSYQATDRTAVKATLANAVVPFKETKSDVEESPVISNVAAVSESKIRMGLWSWLIYQLGSFAKIFGEVF
ncbi:MAG: hypothetical protein HYV68_02645 [Candidatus Taylorbacteria bacterium]|nr:hypothetical protein [Candidatus Taylorbacteria bacterium]